MSMPETPKICVIVIASPGKVYEDFKRIWIENWETHGFHYGTLIFLYGRGLSDNPSKYDIHLDVADSTVPGVLEKTLEMFRIIKDINYDFVFRTNLSSFLDFNRYMPWLMSQKTSGLVAGCSPDRSHIGGCGMTLSRDVVEDIVNHRSDIDTDVVDDLALSSWLFPRYDIVWTKRIDFVYTNQVEVHNCDTTNTDFDDVYHFRFKNYDRTHDPDRMYEIFKNRTGGGL